MSESNLARLIDGKNIALIYFFSVLTFLLYHIVAVNAETINDSIPLSIVAGIFIGIAFLFLILPAVVSLIGIKTKTLRPFPAVLTIIGVVLTLLYLLYMISYGAIGSLYNLLRLPQMLFFLALTLSVLYGFAAYAMHGSSPKMKAARILGSLHAAAGMVLTVFYYGAYFSLGLLVIGFDIWAVLGLAAGILIMDDRQKEESTSRMEKKEKFWIAGVSIVLILILILTGVYFVTGGFDAEYIDFREQKSVPQNVSIISLTEEDYETYPALRDIPQDIRVDKSVFASITSVFGFVDKETRDQILDTYGGYREENRFIQRFIKHNGTVYEIGLLVS